MKQKPTSGPASFRVASIPRVMRLRVLAWLSQRLFSASQACIWAAAGRDAMATYKRAMKSADAVVRADAAAKLRARDLAIADVCGDEHFACILRSMYRQLERELGA